MKIHYVLLRRGFDTFYGSYLGVLDHFTHVRDKYEGYDFHQDEKVLFNASGRFEAILDVCTPPSQKPGTAPTSMGRRL